MPSTHHSASWDVGIVVLICTVVAGVVLLVYLGVTEFVRRRARRLYETEPLIAMTSVVSKSSSKTEDVISVEANLSAADDVESSSEDELPPIPPPLTSEQIIEAANKFSADQIVFGEPEEAAHGLPDFLGLDSDALGAILIGKITAIENEIGLHGTEVDKVNLEMILAGHYVRIDEINKADNRKSLDELLEHPSAIAANLKRHHVLALRLYTTSTFRSVNNAMRKKIRPHPLAATAYFISEGIKLLRAVVNPGQSMIGEVIYWRGLQNRKLDNEFLISGGTEYGCMSTSTDRNIAMGFALGDCPLVFKYVTQDFMQRGADISFLSVFPEEHEVLYPPLTFLRPVRIFFETIPGAGGKRMVIAEVTPVFPS